MRFAAVVLAAGQGTRMRSERPKVLHAAAGRTLLDRVLDTARVVVPEERTVVVVGHGAEEVEAHLASRGVRTALQRPQKGTGHALAVGLEAAPARSDGVVVLSGDVPLLPAAVLEELMTAVTEGAAGALLTTELAEPGAYGRVVRGADGAVVAVIEARDADERTLAVREVNAGVYAFALAPAAEALADLSPDNAQGEYYLTDVVAWLSSRQLPVAAVRLADSSLMQGVNTRADLARVSRLVVDAVLAELMASGVTVVDPASTWVEDGCDIAPDAVLEPGVVVRGASRIGAGARIGAHAVLDGARIGPGVVVPPLAVIPG